MSTTSEKITSLVPGGPWKEEELLICRYNKASYWFFFVIFLGLTIAFCIAKLFMGAIIAVVPAIVFGIYITRCVFVFYPEGVVYRGFFGKVDSFKNEDVLYVTSGGGGKGRYFAIVAKDEVIQLGVQASQFFKAEQCAYNRYPSKEVYERRNKQ